VPRDDVEWVHQDPLDFAVEGGDVLFSGAAAGLRQFSEIRLTKEFADLAFAFFS